MSAWRKCLFCIYSNDINEVMQKIWTNICGVHRTRDRSQYSMAVHTFLLSNNGRHLHSLLNDLASGGYHHKKSQSISAYEKDASVYRIWQKRKQQPLIAGWMSAVCIAWRHVDMPIFMTFAHTKLHSAWNKENMHCNRLTCDTEHMFIGDRDGNDQQITKKK